jgi:hypothetical protein
MKWRFDKVADALADVLERAEGALRLEQAVYGLDALKEKEAQSLLAEGLRQAGFCEVAREAHYPSERALTRPNRHRCDLVLTPASRPLLVAEELDLFTSPACCPPTEALWLEVKCAWQFQEGGRVHGGYGDQWRNATIRDLQKMEAEPLIHEAGLLLLVFTADRQIVHKDLEHFEDVLAMREVLAGFRQVRTIDILERNMHRAATIALWPTVQRALPSAAALES